MSAWRALGPERADQHAMPLGKVPPRSDTPDPWVDVPFVFPRSDS